MIFPNFSFNQGGVCPVSPKTEEWLKKLQACMQEMTETINVISNINLPLASMQAKLPGMQALHKSLLAISKSGWGGEIVQEYESMNPAHEAFLTDFTTLLSALLPQLNRLGAKLSPTMPETGTIQKAEADVFWELWEFLSASFHAFDYAIMLWPTIYAREQKHIFTPLLSAFHALLTGLMILVESPAWRSSTPSHDFETRINQLGLIIAQPTKCMAGLSAAPCVILAEYLGALPLNFMPMLCLIVVKHLSWRVPPQVLRHVKEALDNFALDDKEHKRRGSFEFLRDPSVKNLWRIVA